VSPSSSRRTNSSVRDGSPGISRGSPFNVSAIGVTMTVPSDHAQIDCGAPYSTRGDPRAWNAPDVSLDSTRLSRQSVPVAASRDPAKTPTQQMPDRSDSTGPCRRPVGFARPNLGRDLVRLAARRPREGCITVGSTLEVPRSLAQRSTGSACQALLIPVWSRKVSVRVAGANLSRGDRELRIARRRFRPHAPALDRCRCAVCELPTRNVPRVSVSAAPSTGPRVGGPASSRRPRA
jgi:hypothetical protein